MTDQSVTRIPLDVVPDVELNDREPADQLEDQDGKK